MFFHGVLFFLLVSDFPATRKETFANCCAVESATGKTERLRCEVMKLVCSARPRRGCAASRSSAENRHDRLNDRLWNSQETEYRAWSFLMKVCQHSITESNLPHFLDKR